MSPAAIALHVAAYLISMIAPIGLFVVALVVVRPRRRKGWAWIAAGACLQFVASTGAPAANYAITFWSGRQGGELLQDTMTLAAGVGLAGATLSACGAGLVIVGILRLAEKRPA